MDIGLCQLKRGISFVSEVTRSEFDLRVSYLLSDRFGGLVFLSR